MCLINSETWNIFRYKEKQKLNQPMPNLNDTGLNVT